ncbi:MAG: hypothetical protein O6922_00185 [Chloroflexi bacterium]|nr:hypothetical protein [Chloroflexota bacterium]
MVNAPLQRAWEVVAEANHWPDWAEVCTAVWDAPRKAEDWKPGRQFGFRLKMAMKNVPFNVTVTRVEADSAAGRLIEWSSTKFTITAVRAISVDVVDPGETGAESVVCRVTDKKQFSSRFLPIGLAYPRWLVSRMTESWLDDLKREAESGR